MTTIAEYAQPSQQPTAHSSSQQKLPATDSLDVGVENDICEKGVVDLTHQLHDLLSDEVETVHALTGTKNRQLRVVPTHGFTDLGEFNGFRLAVPPDHAAGSLPINREMFFGVSVAEVQTSRSEKGFGGLHSAAVQLFTDFERSRSTMRSFLEHVRAQSKEAEATLSCAPVFEEETKNAVSAAAHHTRALDSAHWTPDEPEMIGLYHGFVKRPGQHAREHRVFVVCVGGLRRACDEFLNLALDIAQTETTAGDLCDSEETWWLRTACSRSRAALIAQCAEHFGFTVPTHDDLRCFSARRKVAQLATETLWHDLVRLRNNDVACFNSCADPSTPRNGIMVAVAPTEGFLLFRGTPRISGSITDYGAPFGAQQTSGVFPVSTATRTPTSADRRSTTRWALADTCDGQAFVCLDDEARTRSRHHMRLDERFMRALEKLQWSRDFGVVELMPIVVGVF
jgi:hypothetical protein